MFALELGSFSQKIESLREEIARTKDLCIDLLPSFLNDRGVKNQIVDSLDCPPMEYVQLSRAVLNHIDEIVR